MIQSGISKSQKSSTSRAGFALNTKIPNTLRPFVLYYINMPVDQNVYYGVIISVVYSPPCILLRDTATGSLMVCDNEQGLIDSGIRQGQNVSFKRHKTAPQTAFNVRAT